MQDSLVGQRRVQGLADAVPAGGVRVHNERSDGMRGHVGGERRSAGMRVHGGGEAAKM